MNSLLYFDMHLPSFAFSQENLCLRCWNH